MTVRSTLRRSEFGGTPFGCRQRPAEVLAHHRDAQRPGEMGERTDQRRVLLGAHLLQQAHRHQEQGRLVVVELQGWEQAALADAPSTAGLLDVDARVVAQGGNVSLDGARVDLELLGKLPRGQADLGLAQAREQLDDPKLFLTLLVDAWHARSLASRPGFRVKGKRVPEKQRPSFSLLCAGRLEAELLVELPRADHVRFGVQRHHALAMAASHVDAGDHQTARDASAAVLRADPEHADVRLVCCQRLARCGTDPRFELER